MRLFIGIPLPSDIRQALATLEQGIPGARWVAPEYLHMTLCFLGEVVDHQARDLDEALAALRVPRFDLTFGGLGLFGDRRQPRILYLDMTPSPILNRLVNKVENAAHHVGLTPERRKFKGHVTLARLKNPSRPHLGGFIERNASLRFDPFTVQDFILYRSHLGQSGAHYDDLVHYPLMAQEDPVDQAPPI